MSIPSTCRVLGNAGGKGAGGRYSKRMLGLYMEISSSSFPLVLLAKVSNDEMRPVEKNVGRVCCRT